MGSTMGWLSCSLALQILFAVLYSRVVTAPLVEGGKLDKMMTNGPDSGRDDFNTSIFGCFSDRWVCLQGTFCPMVRIAHTNAVTGVCPFWETLWCYCCCAWLTLNMGPCCLLMWWRLRLKNIMKVDESAMNDFCITMFCPQISLCQMSTAADQAMGYQMTGCCEYTPYGYGGGMEPMEDH
jgi:Cys-rich protein (TIGR01571 family)